ncbi:hypothetical protein RHMOL_Rhmol04G0227200 [Rhododendron molle]|uniref:Uncharacterized protein n=1 Tax=Rhododendron molle TaxID=49168 RepID=A0ACC0P347_RHOML|nr:hypothetical protein RHMOL_Rhmol04G0227200 [Rhododendron molle]
MYFSLNNLKAIQKASFITTLILQTSTTSYNLFLAPQQFSLTPEEEDDIVIDTDTHAPAVEACAFSLVGKVLSKRRFSKAA